MSHATIKPVRLRQHDDDLGVDRSRVIGYRVVEEGKESGPVRKTYALARRDLRGETQAAQQVREDVSPAVSAEA